jgi:hypothetical protein
MWGVNLLRPVVMPKRFPAAPLNCQAIDGDKKCSFDHDSSGSNNDLQIQMAPAVNSQSN